MTLGAKMEKYHGVQCRSCGETIAVPSRIASKEARSEPSADSAGNEGNYPSLNLRCRVCEKENFYKLSDIREIEETPVSSMVRQRPSPTRLRPLGRLSKAAKA
jgi:hypothetical protein